jgi:hypothetical protein
MARDDDDRPLTPMEQIIDRCGASRDRRRTTYRYLRHWYERGTDTGGPPALFNRLHAHVDLLSSMIYAPESARFWISVSAAERAGRLAELDIARDEFSQLWRNSGADVEFATHVEWAGVYGTMLAKVLPAPGGRATYRPIDPAAFGVLREDVPQLDRQPAFVHWYVISLPELRDKIRALPLAEQAVILEYAEGHALPHQSAGVDQGLPGGMVSDVIVTSVSDTTQVTGYLDLGAMNQDRPEVLEPLVELAEVWVRAAYTREERQQTYRFWDYRVSTCLGPHVLWEARNPVLPWSLGGDGVELPAECPFIKLCINPRLDNFWGRSEIASLTRLQQVADEHLLDVRDMMGRQLDPPALVTGWQQTQDKLDVMRKKGGYAATNQPGGRLFPLIPQMPPEAFHLLETFDRMFNEEGGIPQDLGTAQEDIRVQGQIVGTARKMGRIRKKALTIEDALESLATRMFHVQQRNDPTRYETSEGTRFVLASLPAEAVVKVTAHSASPVYAELAMEKALVLYKAGAIDDAALIEILDPPFMELLREKSYTIMQRKAEMAERKMEVEEQKARRAARR